MSSYMIETAGLTKEYPDKVALEGLDLAINQGEIFGLLGPNGAGKTTLMLIILGLTYPTAGTCRVCGFDPIKEPIEVKRICGYLPESLGFYEDLNAIENLTYMASLNRIPKGELSRRIEEALKKVNLDGYNKTKVGKFSRGMKQRLAIANVLIKKPRVALLDEPTQGIDPKGIGEVLDIIKHLSTDEGTTILLSSHVLPQVKEICNRVGIMMKGRLLKVGPVEGLGKFDKHRYIIDVELGMISKKLINELSEMTGVSSVRTNGNKIKVECDRDIRTQISESVFRRGVPLLSLNAEEESLDSVYMKYLEGG